MCIEANSIGQAIYPDSVEDEDKYFIGNFMQFPFPYPSTETGLKITRLWLKERTSRTRNISSATLPETVRSAIAYTDTTSRKCWLSDDVIIITLRMLVDCNATAVEIRRCKSLFGVYPVSDRLEKCNVIDPKILMSKYAFDGWKTSTQLKYKKIGKTCNLFFRLTNIGSTHWVAIAYSKVHSRFVIFNSFHPTNSIIQCINSILLFAYILSDIYEVELPFDFHKQCKVKEKSQFCRNNLEHDIDTLK